MKKIFLILFIIMISYMSIEAVPVFGLLEEAENIPHYHLERGAMFGFFYSQIRTLLNTRYKTAYSVASLPSGYFTGNLTNLDNYQPFTFAPLLFIPTIHGSYTERHGLKNDMELSYNITMCTPDVLRFGIYGPELIWDFGLKKTVEKQKRLVAWKINWGFMYNATLGGDIVVKHAVILGSKNTERSKNFSLFMQNSIGMIHPDIEITYLYTTVFFYGTTSFGFEYVIIGKNDKGLRRKHGIYARYELSYALLYNRGDYSNRLIYDETTHCGNLEIGYQFGFARIRDKNTFRRNRNK